MPPREDINIKIPKRFYEIFKKYEKSSEAKVFYDYKNITIDEYTTWQNYNTENYVTVSKPTDFLTRRRFIFIFFGPKRLVIDVEKTFLGSYNKNSDQEFTKYTSKYDDELKKWVPDDSDSDADTVTHPDNAQEKKSDLVIKIYKVVKRKQCRFELYQLSLVIDGLVRNRKKDWLNDVREFLGVEPNVATDSIFHIESHFTSPVPQYSDEKHINSDDSSVEGKLKEEEAELVKCYACERKHDDKDESEAIPVYQEDFVKELQGKKAAKSEKSGLCTCSTTLISRKRRQRRRRSKSSSSSFNARSGSVSKKSRSEEHAPKSERKRRSREANRKSNSRNRSTDSRASSSPLHVKENFAKERLLATLKMENFGDSENLSKLDQLISEACTTLGNCNAKLLEIYQNDSKLGLSFSDRGGEGEIATHIDPTFTKLQESARNSCKLLSKTLWDSDFLVAYRMSRRVVFDLQNANGLLKTTSMNKNLAEDLGTLKIENDSIFTFEK